MTVVFLVIGILIPFPSIVLAQESEAPVDPSSESVAPEETPAIEESDESSSEEPLEESASGGETAPGESESSEEMMSDSLVEESIVEDSGPEGLEEESGSEELEEEVLPDDDLESMMSSYDGTDGTPTTPNPNIFTYQSTRPQVEKYTGALTQEIPLDIPPGRSGLQPNIELEYNSQSSADSIVGYGWSLSIPYIERLNKSGSERIYTDNYFTSSLGGELATTSTSTPNEYRHKTEDGRFITYTFSDNAWVAYDKKGTRYTFGTTTQARQFDVATSSNVHRWMIEEIRDTNNNYIKFVYLKESNQIYPSQILYTGHGAVNGPMTITFATSTRPDPYTHFLSGVKVTTNYRISEVTAAVNGSWMRKYALDYDAGNNGVRSLLASITQTGKDSNNVELEMPPITFGYISSTTPFVKTAPSAVKSVSQVVTDVNGNGVNDISVFYHQVSNSTDHGLIKYEGSNDSSFSSPPVTWAVSTVDPIEYLPTEQGIRFFDINGDGRADIVQGRDDQQTSIVTKALWLSSTTSERVWNSVASTTWSGDIPIFAYTTAGGTHTLSTGVLGDVNGDGVSDFIRGISGYVPGGSDIGTGLGWIATTTFAPPLGFPAPGGTPMTNNQLIDINGDGLDDFMYSDSSNIYFLLNHGTGWESSADARWTLATSTLYHSSFLGSPVYWDRGIRFLDINGDGLTDFVRAYTVPSYNCTGFTCAAAIEVSTDKYAYLNTGSGWATTTMTLPSAYITTGVLDGGGHWTGDLRFNEYVNLLGNGKKEQDVLSSINYPTGGSSEIEYSFTGAQQTHAKLPVSLLVVSSITNDDNNGNEEETTYTYHGGEMYLEKGIRERKLAGFGTITEQNPAAITKSYFHQGNVASTTVGEAIDDRSLIGRIYRQDILSTTTGALVKRTFKNWQSVDQGSNDRRYVYVEKEMQQDFDSSGNHRDAAAEFTYSTTTGNLTQVTKKGEVIGASDGTFSDTASDTVTKVITYAASSSSNLYVPTHETVTNNSSAKVKESLFYYDSQSFGTVHAGNLTKREDWIASTSYASTTKAYNQYGLVTSEIDPRSKTTSYTYDSLNYYVATSTNALSHVNAYVYDYATGKHTEVKDPNGKVRQFVFDPVGRQKEVKVQDPVSGSIVTHSTITYTDNVFPSKQQESISLSAATTSDTYMYFDGLGRKIQTRSEAPGSNTYIVSDAIYSPLGKVVRESLPYFASSTSYAAATSTATLFTNYVFDTLLRPVIVTNSVGTTTTAYGAWAATTTDANGGIKGLVYDAYGNLVRVLEQNDADLYVTLYTYDANNNLTKITDALENIRNFTYDGLSRRLTAEDLHAVGDGTFGTYTFTYDAAGNLTQKVDPKSQTINSTYDDVNRLLTEDYTGGTGTEMTFTYDSCTNGTGRICTASSTDALTTYTYNALGLPASETRTINNSAYTTAFLYDRQGNQTDITYPNGIQLLYGYDASGRLADIQTKIGASATTSIVRAVDYAPTGAVKYNAYGNGTENFYTFNPRELYRLASIAGTSTVATEATSSPFVAAIQFSGSNSATTTSSGLPSSSNARSIEAWVKTTTATEGYIAGWGASNAYFALTVKDDEIRIRTNEGIGHWWTAPDITDGNWHHIAVSYSGGDMSSDSNIKAYMDGDLTPLTTAGTAGTTPNTGTGHVAFSLEPGAASDGKFTGKIDDVRFWNIARSASDFQSTYNAPLTGSESGLVGYYKFDNSYDDSSSNNNVPVPQGSPTFVSDTPSGTSGTTITNPQSSQFINYEYDAVGNIVSIEDTSTTNALKTVEFEYDLLSRLRSASTTVATSTPYWETYTYNELGNLTSKSRAGLYSHTATGDVLSAAIGLAGSSGISLSLNGSSWLNKTSVSNLPSGSSARTIEAWVKMGTTSETYIGGWGGSSAYFAISINSNVIGARSNEGKGHFWTAPSLSDGNWHHVAITYAGGDIASDSNAKAYMDGNTTPLTTSSVASGTLNSGTGHISIGDEPGSSGNANVIGNIDEVRFWSTARSASDIATFYDQELSGGETGLVGYYRLNNDYTDASASANHLSGNGSPAFEDDGPFAGSDLLHAPDLYQYQGTNYANPHAPTQIASTTLTYDNNGNLTTYGLGSFTYDYRNRMTQSVLNGTTTNGYDHADQRVLQIVASSSRATTTTIYPSKYFSSISQTDGATTTSTTTSYIYLGSTLVSTIDQSYINGVATGTPTIRYIHPDHLGSTNVVTNSSGSVVQTLDYYPFGTTRIDSGTDVSAREYIGEMYDETSNLSYLNARFYDALRGQFQSQDPTFLAIGDPARMQSSIGVTQDFVLRDPQVMNSYSYARNNPISMKDPNGNFPAAVIPFLLFGTGALVNVTAQGIEDRVSGNPFAWENYAGAAAGGIAGTASLLSGYGAPAVGAVTSGVEDAATQGLSLATGRQDSYSPAQTLGQTAEGAFFGKYLNPKLAGVTVGSNSFKAVQGQIMTKLSNGTIQSFTPQTASKMLTNQFVGSLPQSFAAGALGNSSILSSIQSQLSAIQKTLSKLIESSKKK